LIFHVFNYNTAASYFDPALDVEAEEKANALLVQNRADVLALEDSRFSIAATFASGSDVVWRNMLETDPEEYTYQVFNTFTGQHDAYPTKTEALAAKAMLQEQFLTSLAMDKVYTVEKIPAEQQPAVVGAQEL